jgi:DNA replicative helicase MCM subunit Mcm2 (Cdc46/Mcm family)
MAVKSWDEMYPDRIWGNNLSTLFDWLYMDSMKKLKDGETFTVNVSHPYIKPFFDRFGEDFEELALHSLMKSLQRIYFGKKLVGMSFQHVKIKTEEDVNAILRGVDLTSENKPLTFNSVILAVGRRQAYVKVARFKCLKCGADTKLACNNKRKIKAPVCGTRSCRGATMDIDESDVVSDFVQDIVIQEPVDEIVNNQPIQIDAKLIGDDVGHSYMGQKKKITGIGIMRVEYDTKGKQKDIYMDVMSIKDLDDVSLVMPEPELVDRLVADSDKADYLDKILDSFAPHIFGYKKIKLALLLAVVSKRGKIKKRRGLKREEDG